MEYKVVIFQERLLGSLFLGQSKVNPLKFAEFLIERQLCGGTQDAPD